MKVILEIFRVLKWYEVSTFCSKWFELLFIAFRGINAETILYIDVGAVNALSINWMGESIGRPEAWLSKALALSVDGFTLSVSRPVRSMIPTKTQPSSILAY